ncbi:MAG: DUF2950 family protein [Planctomycetota bacterium]
MGLTLLVGGCGVRNVPTPPVLLTVLETSAASAPGVTPTVPARRKKIHLARYVAPGGIAMLHMPDMAGTAKRFKKTAIYRILKSAEFKEAFGQMTAAFKGFSMTGGGMGIDTNKINNALNGDLIVSLEDVAAPAGPGQPPVIKLLVAADLGPAATKEIDKLLALLTAMAGSNPDIRVEKGAAAGTQFTRVVLLKQNKLAFEIATHQGAVLFGVGRETVTQAIDRVNSEQASVEDQESYKDAMKRLGDPRDAMRLFVDLSAIQRKVGRHMPPEAVRVLTQLGLNSVRGAAMAVRLDGEDIVTSMFLDSPDGEDVITRLLRKNSVDMSLLDLIPQDAASFSLFSVDGPAMLEELRKVLPGDQRKQMEDSLKMLSDSGFDIERDVLDVFGPRCAFVQTSGMDGPSKGIEAVWRHVRSTVLVCEVQDPVRAIEALARLPQGDASVHRKEHMVQGVKTNTYRFDADELPAEFSVSVALAGDHLYISLSVEALKKMLETAQSERTGAFAKIAKALPGPVAALSYDDPSRGVLSPMSLADLSSDLARGPVAASAGGDEPHAGLGRLLRALGPTVSYVTADEDGVVVVTRSPTAGLGSTGGITGMFTLASIALPSLASARVTANEASALSALEAIHSAEDTFRKRGYHDPDRDGDGSYGFLAQLTGQDDAGTSLSQTPLLRSDYFEVEDGVCRREGYYFRVVLPAEDGAPVGGHEKDRHERADGDLSESVIVVLAWPVSHGRTGRRSFLMDSRGFVYATDASFSGRAPRADALNTQPNNIASAPKGFDEPAQDGNRWRKVR